MHLHSPARSQECEQFEYSLAEKLSWEDWEKLQALILGTLLFCLCCFLGRRAQSTLNRRQRACVGSGSPSDHKGCSFSCSVQPGMNRAHLLEKIPPYSTAVSQTQTSRTSPLPQSLAFPQLRHVKRYSPSGHREDKLSPFLIPPKTFRLTAAFLCPMRQRIGNNVLMDGNIYARTITFHYCGSMIESWV